MTAYFLLSLSILSAAANNLLLHKFGNRGLDGLSGALLFNAAVSGVWIALLGAAAALTGGLAFDAASVQWGMLYGGVTAAFLLFKMQAMASGPVSLTSVIGCASLLISTGFGVFVLGEAASAAQAAGVALLMIALFLIISPKSDQATRTWKLWCAGFFVCSAAVGIIFKLHQRSDSAAKISEMMLAAALTSAVVFIAAAFAASGRRRLPALPAGAWPYILGSGLFGCVYNRLNIFLAGRLPSVVFYPTFNGAVILLSTLCGLLLFRERLRARQTIGMIAGIAALLLASGAFDSFFA